MWSSRTPPEGLDRERITSWSPRVPARRVAGWPRGPALPDEVSAAGMPHVGAAHHVDDHLGHVDGVVAEALEVLGGEHDARWRAG